MTSRQILAVRARLSHAVNMKASAAHAQVCLPGFACHAALACRAALGSGKGFVEIICVNVNDLGLKLLHRVNLLLDGRRR